MMNRRYTNEKPHQPGLYVTASRKQNDWIALDCGFMIIIFIFYI